MNYPLKEFIQQYKSNTILNKDINIEKNEILLNNFNKKYNLNIKDTNIEILNLDNQKIRNEGLKDLYKIENNNIFDKKIKINSNIYYPQNSYKNNDISGIKNNIYEKKVNKIINNNYYNLYNSIKYEDLIILEDKMINIIFSLNQEKIIYNDCFEFLNYFFNNSLYDNLNIIYSNYNYEYKTMIKMGINYILLSIILSYDISYEENILNKIRPLLKEMLELSYKLLICIYDYILNILPNTSKKNIWIIKLSNLIKKLKLSDESDSFYVDSEIIKEKEKLNSNINFLSKKIYYILNNYPTNNSSLLLNNFFKKKIHEKNVTNIRDMFLDFIFHEKNLHYSVLAYSLIKYGEKIKKNISPPYIKFRNSKKYFLIIDLDETLFHLKLAEEDEDQDVLKIRPGVFRLIQEIKNYYEIIIFSEAEKDYIDVTTDALGNIGYLFDYILCRDFICIEENNFIKDLNKIGTPINKTIIIDNMPQNFRKNKENAIYIKSFFGEDNDDKALTYLIPILINIAKSGKDVRDELIKYKEKIVENISSNFYKHNNINY